jgi:diguanylate cyclase (GGDEF)-like protein
MEIIKYLESPLFLVSPNIDIKMKLLKENDLLEEVLRLSKNRQEAKNIDKIIYFMFQYHKTKHLSREAMEYFKKECLSEYEKFILNSFLAFYYFDQNSYEDSEPYLKYAVEYLNTKEDLKYERMCIYYLTAKFLEKTVNIFLSGAENYFLKALEYSNELQDDLSSIAILNSLSYYYHNIEKIDSALEYAKIALDNLNKINIDLVSFSTYKNLGIIYLTLGDLKNSVTYFERAINIANRNDDFDYLERVKMFNTIGYAYFMQGEFEKAKTYFCDALEYLTKVTSTTRLLDEAVKTLDNLSNALKMMGYYEDAIKILSLAKDIFENINFRNRANEVHNLSKIYIDLAYIYAMYLEDKNMSKKYYDLAKIGIKEDGYYIKKNRFKILEDIINNKNSFENHLEDLKKRGKQNTYVQYILIEILLYYYKTTKDNKYKDLAFEIAREHNLIKHYEVIYNAFTYKAMKKGSSFDYSKYPLTLLYLLSEERKQVISAIKRSEDFELVENFIGRINRATNLDDMFNSAKDMINKHFFTKGLAVINKLKIVLYTDGDCQSEVLKREVLNAIRYCKDNEYCIYNFDSSKVIKSCVVIKMKDTNNKNLTYFVVFNEKNSDWVFTHEEAKTINILFKDLYLKMKEINYYEEIKESATKDTLTGLYNYKHFITTLNDFIKSYYEANKDFWISIIDLNGFKQINDIYGHDVGDFAIKYFSDVLKNKFKRHDYVFRYGGDEFIILSHRNQDYIEEKLKQIKLILKERPLIIEDKRIILDFSFGIKKYDGEDSRAFFKSADKKMYMNKRKWKEDLP